ncbi:MULTISPECIES: glycosyltransferase family 87 protein [unclassified Streptomyces]|uniref:glycosyltransferase family 87 protein n=1 Tax=unclassified Streptomyces TaxID=2593676 RepID=UPI0022543DF2|nr:MULTISPECIES: glycosyltransferase 87 family protein [unclassified Streptomyces]WSP56262.1 glycosyltransferase 87 family protein [Streptomyces sp. NBC_01241]MCX4787978.1 glycosyltransferase 87 family protein [Streptomyces sp. NBC_01221]MCX4796260.1 glycosyltransferase 87 family protein [Streptomyces sp. NBC_01242]WSJ37506.1 glycosyltransferase 87 family protein [Streptomyces sp. NBC_01321]WSP63905.1 glycosyltransferase 87 family protein [Streptomyces sp. NBC_01240]
MPSAEETSVHEERPVVRPTHQDEIAEAGSELIGGRSGRWTRLGSTALTPVGVIALVALGMFVLGMVQKLPCYNWAWFRGAGSQYTHACYSDIPHLYVARGFSEGLVPYFDRLPGDMQYLEYPVLTGVFMQIASWLTPGGSIQHREQMYWMVNAGMLMICAVIIAVCVARTHRRRPWDGLLVALAPAFALTATINWDLLAVALTAAAVLMWARGRAVAFGILIGLATAAKLYPVLLLGPLFVLCWRAGKWRELGLAALGTAASWLVVNLPVMAFAPEGWNKFYTFSEERGIDFGSFWLIITQRTGNTIEVSTVNDLSILLMLVLCAAIGALTLMAPRRPRFAQLAFLVVAAFILVNKVYSPQYVLWLIPLAALARPRWRDFLIWQACEVMYFLGIWMYLAYTTSGDKHQGLPVDGYQLAIILHLLGTLYLCAVVVRDILMPERDVVRRDGSDDPSGGVLDGARDVFVLRRAAHPPRHAVPAVEGPRVDWGEAHGPVAD